MASRLTARLERIRRGQQCPSVPERKAPPENTVSFSGPSFQGTHREGADDGATDVPSALADAGWTRTAPLLLERTSGHPVPDSRFPLSQYFSLLFPRERLVLSSLCASSRMSSSLVFFDLETTGLSRGAGTVAFMAGIARFLPGETSLTVHQLLLEDYPGEPGFLSRFLELLGDDPVLVSFNGKCFDWQILASRFLMNGMRAGIMAEPPLHLDLLFPSRRIWKSVSPSCRLTVLEELVLGRPRGDDLPGSEAPDAWFDFVRDGKTERLVAIGEHNQDDCLGLAGLLFALDRAIDTGTGRAALIRALDLRSRRDYSGASIFLSPLAAAGDPTALRLSAIDCEHRTGELERALSCAERLGDERRTARLRDKLARTGELLR